MHPDQSFAFPEHSCSLLANYLLTVDPDTWMPRWFLQSSRMRNSPPYEAYRNEQKKQLALTRFPCRRADQDGENTVTLNELSLSILA